MPLPPGSLRVRAAEPDLDRLMAQDAPGYTPRAARYGDKAPAAAVATLLERGGADHVVLDPGVRRALERAAAGGWTCVIVTNGRTGQQEAKIRGDSPAVDVAGAHALGVPSVWVSAGRPRPEARFTPTRRAPDAATAIGSVLASAGA
ncbi:hypothetical protein [Streptomyces sp. NPDC051183]|uniref:HAD family hydrolase n=1 Tax=Streptomyces sp. NPDC051183 TaxID=3155165 RepID=UPI003435D620